MGYGNAEPDAERKADELIALPSSTALFLTICPKFASMSPLPGEVAERLNAPVSKTG